ncbi:MAG: prepilin peptidase [Pseudomonadota bacterium]
MLDAASELARLAADAPLSAILVAAPVFFLVSAACSDAYRFIIPNWCGLGLVVGWLAAWAVSPLGWGALFSHGIVFLVALVCSVLLFELGVWGGGDAKLAPAGLLWVGWPAALEALLVMSYVSIALALMVLGVRLVRRRRPAPARAPDAPPSETEGIERETHAPYGLAIAAGCLWMLAQAPVVAALAPDLSAALR